MHFWNDLVYILLILFEYTHWNCLAFYYYFARRVSALFYWLHVTATKFLGIIIDDRLNWKPQIQSVKSKLSSILSVMYKASKLITTAGMYT